MSDALPRGWATTSLGAVCEEKVAQGPPMEEPVQYIDISAIDRLTKRVGETTLVTGKDAPSRARQWVRKDDVLVSMTRPNLNAVAQVGSELDGAVASTGFDVLRSRAVDPRWIYYRVRTNDFVADVCKGLQGVVYPAIRPHDVRQHELPLPPLPEQHRIVSAIESYFTRLDDAVATLERVQRNLNRYRASVLKAAVEGRLVPTEAEMARAEGRSYEPASVLLTRILAERRRRWEEAELEKMKAKGKAPKDDKWKAKYKEPTAPDTSELPELPDGWCWATVDQLGDVSGGLTQNSKREALPLKLPFLRVANVYANELRLDEIKTIGVSEQEISRVRLSAGDLLVVEGNGSIEQIGRVALWDGTIDPCLHQNHIIKVRFAPLSLSTWSLYWLLAPAGRAAIERTASSTSGLHTLSLSKVQSLPVPLAPLQEQTRITSELDRLITTMQAAASEVATNIQRLARLRQSILKWAFEGRLVDQDPTDEPASVLLERIRAEREGAIRTVTGKRGRVRENAAP